MANPTEINIGDIVSYLKDEWYFLIPLEFLYVITLPVLLVNDCEEL